MVAGRLREAAEVHEARLDRRGRALVGAVRARREAFAARRATVGFVLGAYFHMTSCEAPVPLDENVRQTHTSAFEEPAGPHSVPCWAFPGLTGPERRTPERRARGRASSARTARGAPEPAARRWRRCHRRALDGLSRASSRRDLQWLPDETIGNACGLLRRRRPIVGDLHTGLDTRLGQRPSLIHI